MESNRKMNLNIEKNELNILKKIITKSLFANFERTCKFFLIGFENKKK